MVVEAPWVGRTVDVVLHDGLLRRPASRPPTTASRLEDRRRPRPTWRQRPDDRRRRTDGVDLDLDRVTRVCPRADLRDKCGRVGRTRLTVLCYHSVTKSTEALAWFAFSSPGRMRIIRCTYISEMKLVGSANVECNLKLVYHCHVIHSSSTSSPVTLDAPGQCSSLLLPVQAEKLM